MNSFTKRLSLWAFAASLVFITLGLIQKVSWGGVVLEFRQIDATVIFALLGPTLGSYTVRRYTDTISGDKDNTLSK